MRVTLILLSVWTATQALAASAKAKPAEAKKPAGAQLLAKAEPPPAAIIVEVVGKAQVIRDRKTIPAFEGQRIAGGDIVKCPDKSKVTLFLSNTKEIVVGPKKSVTIVVETKPDKETTERWKKLVDLLLPRFDEKRSKTTGMPAVRGTPAPVSPLEPVQPAPFDDEGGARVTGKVLATAPVFIFTPSEPSRVYRLRIYAAGDELLVDRVLTEKELYGNVEETSVIVARPDVGTLPATTLRWEVLAGNSDVNRTKKSAFRAIDPAKDAALAAAWRAMPEGEEPVKQLMRGAVLESEGFFGDAIVCYLNAIHANRKEPMHRLLLAKLYDRLEKYTLADRERASVENVFRAAN